MDTEWGWSSTSAGSALLAREHVPVGLLDRVPAPRQELRPAVFDAGDPPDVRLYAPTPETVIVWVAGRLHPRAAALLVMRVRQQFHRAPHVIIDLSPVTWMDWRVVGELRALHAKAEGCGVRLHIAAEHDLVVEGLQQLAVNQHVVFGSAAAVLAGLALGNG